MNNPMIIQFIYSYICAKPSSKGIVISTSKQKDSADKSPLPVGISGADTDSKKLKPYKRLYVNQGLCVFCNNQDTSTGWLMRFGKDTYGRICSRCQNLFDIIRANSDRCGFWVHEDALVAEEDNYYDDFDTEFNEDSESHVS